MRHYWTTQVDFMMYIQQLMDSQCLTGLKACGWRLGLDLNSMSIAIWQQLQVRGAIGKVGVTVCAGWLDASVYELIIEIELNARFIKTRWIFRYQYSQLKWRVMHSDYSFSATLPWYDHEDCHRPRCDFSSQMHNCMVEVILWKQLIPCRRLAAGYETASLSMRLRR